VRSFFAGLGVLVLGSWTAGCGSSQSPDTPDGSAGSCDGGCWRPTEADLAFIEGPTSAEEVKRIVREVKGPVFYNMTGVSPRFTLDEMRAMGIAMCISPNAMLRSALGALPIGWLGWGIFRQHLGDLANIGNPIKPVVDKVGELGSLGNTMKDLAGTIKGLTG